MDTKTFKTHNETVLKRVCATLSEYYALSDKKVREIYEFLFQSEENAISTSQNRFVLLTKNNPVKSFTAEPKFNDVSSFYVTAEKMSMIPSGASVVPVGLSSQDKYRYFLANTSNNNNNND